MSHLKFLALNADTPVSKEQEGCKIAISLSPLISLPSSEEIVKRLCIFNEKEELDDNN